MPLKPKPVTPLKEARKPNDTSSAHMATLPCDGQGPAINKWSGLGFLTPPQGADELGRLGKYRVLKKLGQGGMGMVLLAEDTALGRHVALKVMSPSMAESGEAKQRFFREARAMAAIKHDHIATVYDVGEERSVPFLAMEFLQGVSLADRLNDKQRLPMKECLRIARETAEGLAAAHERGLIHRDIKPGNLWLEAPNGRVKILDFGLARISGDAANLTAEGAILGTPSFMAPEQTEGKPADHHADLFSLGVVLYLLCAGELPFQGRDLINLLYAVVASTPKPVRDLNPQVPTALANLIDRLLAKPPSSRPGTADDVAHALRAIERDLRRKPDSPTAAKEQKAPVPPPPPPLPVKVGSPAASKEQRALASPPPPPLPVKAGGGGKAIAAVVGLLLIGGGVAGYFLMNAKEPGETKIAGLTSASKTPTGAKPTATKPTPPTPTNTTQPSRPAETPHASRPFDAPPPPKHFPPLDQKWLKEVRAMSGQDQVEEFKKEMKNRNPNANLPDLRRTYKDLQVVELYLQTSCIDDITPIRVFSQLQSLSLFGARQRETTGVGRLRDLSPLRGMKLTSLSCTQNQVSDLAPLTGMPLKHLEIRGNQVTSLEPLRGMPLVKLDCRQNAGLLDFTPLKDCPQLEELNCDFLQPRDSRPLKSLKKLTTINGKPAAEFWKEIDGKR